MRNHISAGAAASSALSHQLRRRRGRGRGRGRPLGPAELRFPGANTIFKEPTQTKISWQPVHSAVMTRPAAHGTRLRPPPAPAVISQHAARNGGDRPLARTGKGIRPPKTFACSLLACFHKNYALLIWFALITHLFCFENLGTFVSHYKVQELKNNEDLT